MRNTTTAAMRFAMFLCGIAAGSYSLAAAIRNGQALGGNPVDAAIFAVGFGSVVAGSWFILPLAERAWKTRCFLRAAIMFGGFAMCLAFVMANATSFTASHRTAGVASRTVSNEAYDRASIQLRALQSDLETMKAAKRYAATAGCTNATAEASIALCGQVRAKEAELAQARATLALGRPGSPDAQADAIAEILPAGISAAQVSAKMPALLGITTELAAILFFFCSVPPGQRIVEVEPIVLTMTPEAKPATPPLEAPTPPAARQIAAPKKTAIKAKAKTKALPAPAITDRMDGRTIAGMRKRAANLA